MCEVVIFQGRSGLIQDDGYLVIFLDTESFLGGPLLNIISSILGLFKGQ